MWATLLALILKGFNLIWPDKTAEQVANESGVSSGIAQQKASDEAATIEAQKNVIQKQQDMAAVPSVDDSAALKRLSDGTV